MELPHTPIVTVYTYGSAPVRHGFPDEEVTRFTLDLDRTRPLPEPYVIKGEIHSKGKGSKGFTKRSMAAIAMLETADALPHQTKEELVRILEEMIKHVRGLPNQVIEA